MKIKNIILSVVLLCQGAVFTNPAKAQLSFQPAPLTTTLAEASYPAPISPVEKKSKQIRHSTFLTLNVQTLPLTKETGFFDIHNFSYGLKIGTMRKSGWYLSLMSNFWFPGTFRAGNTEQLTDPMDVRNSYFEGMLGLTGRYWKPMSFHFGIGMNYRTTNYLCRDHVWRNQQTERGYGPVVASGFMFHITGFVISAEAVLHYSIQEGSFRDNLYIGAKVGTGFCLVDKKGKKNMPKKEKHTESALTRSLVPITATPEYGGRNTGSALPDILFAENRSVESLDDEDLPDTQEKKATIATPATEDLASVNKNAQQTNTTETGTSQSTTNETVEAKSDAISAEDLLKEGLFPAEEETADTLDAQSSEPKPCGKLKVTDADHNVYHTVTIGSQCWMAENLRSTTDPWGHRILQGRHADSNIAYRYCPGGDTATVRAYGYLYNWKAASGQTWILQQKDTLGRGICPEGWHLPNSAEWDLLALYLASYDEYVCGGQNGRIGKSIAAARVWRASDKDCAIGNNPKDNNASGFSALPTGNYNGTYTGFGRETGFWCHVSDGKVGPIRTLRTDSDSLLPAQPDNAAEAYPVRCVMD